MTPEVEGLTMNMALRKRMRWTGRIIETVSWLMIGGLLIWANVGCTHAARLDGDFEMTIHLWDVGISIRADEATSEAEIADPETAESDAE